MKKQTNKLSKILLIVALVAVAAVLVILIANGLKGKNEHANEETEAIDATQMDPIKSDEDIFVDNEFLIESFNEYEDGDRFYLAGTNLIDYDKMYVFFGELSREEILQALHCNYEEIKDKAADDVLVVFQKGNVLMRLFNMKESDCGFNFKVENNDLDVIVQSAEQDVFFKTVVENGVKIHYLDAVQEPQPIYEATK